MLFAAIEHQNLIVNVEELLERNQAAAETHFARASRHMSEVD
jgi:hypothetical protein